MWAGYTAVESRDRSHLTRGTRSRRSYPSTYACKGAYRRSSATACNNDACATSGYSRRYLATKWGSRARDAVVTGNSFRTYSSAIRSVYTNNGRHSCYKDSSAKSRSGTTCGGV